MKRKAGNGTLRIISGKYSGRKITVPDVLELRPTTDAIRETLFNWLQTSIWDSVCLDLFAGSGALSFEALSRGAKKAYLVDNHPQIIANLRQQALLLGIDTVEIIEASIPTQHLVLPKNTFDLVFIDPPFHKGLAAKTCSWLEALNCLKTHCLIYIETEATLKKLTVPLHWQLLKEKTTGAVSYYLYARHIGQ